MVFRKKKEIREDSVNTDRYLITYADLITLLLGLFVILYVTAQVDESKYKAFANALTGYFNSSKEQVLKGNGGILQGHKNSIPEPIFQNASMKTLQDVKTSAEIKLNKFIKNDDINVFTTPEGLVLSLQEKLLFQSGSADIQTYGLSLLDTLTNIFKDIEFQISVDGHTDAVPIRTFRYESNWHLSVARALNVAYALIEKGVPERLFVVRGFSSQRPSADNITNEGKLKNRRVEILISELPSNVPSKNGFSSEK